MQRCTQYLRQILGVHSRGRYSAPFFFGLDVVESLLEVEVDLDSVLLAVDSLDAELVLEPPSVEVLSAAADFL